MKQSVCSIYIQFSLFLISYVIIVVTDSIFGWFRIDFMHIFFWHELILFINEILPLFPICYVLYIHRQTFKHDKKERDSEELGQNVTKDQTHRES